MLSCNDGRVKCNSGADNGTEGLDEYVLGMSPFMEGDDAFIDFALYMGRGGASVGSALGVVERVERMGPFEGLISGDGSSPRIVRRLPNWDVACERVARGVEATDWGDTNVAGDDNAFSTTVTSSRVDTVVITEVFFAFTAVMTRDGVDPDPVASKPRMPEWE